MLFCGFAASNVNAAQCGVDQYRFVQSDLAANDQLTLTIGSNVMNATLDANTALAGEWSKVLAELVNQNVSSDIASGGSLANLTAINRYLPESNADNVIDVKQSAGPVSLHVNGQDAGNLMFLPYGGVTGTSEGSAIIPSWNKKFISSVAYNFINLSNTSDEQINVKLKFYQQDGTVYTEATEGGTQFYNNTSNVVNFL